MKRTLYLLLLIISCIQALPQNIRKINPNNRNFQQQLIALHYRLIAEKYDMSSQDLSHPETLKNRFKSEARHILLTRHKLQQYKLFMKQHKSLKLRSRKQIDAETTWLDDILTRWLNSVLHDRQEINLETLPEAPFKNSEYGHALNDVFTDLARITIKISSQTPLELLAHVAACQPKKD